MKKNEIYNLDINQQDNLVTHAPESHICKGADVWLLAQDSAPRRNPQVKEATDRRPWSFTFKVLVKCKSSKDKIAGIKDGKLDIRLKTKPEQGKANEALIGILSKEFKINKKNITIVSGKYYKEKIIRLKDINQDYFKEKISQIEKGEKI